MSRRYHLATVVIDVRELPTEEPEPSPVEPSEGPMLDDEPITDTHVLPFVLEEAP